MQTMQKTLVKIDNDTVHISGYDDSFYRFVDADGNELAGGLWGAVYVGRGYDDEKNEYHMVWSIVDAETDDESKACNWEYPDQVTLDGKNVTDKVDVF